MMKNISIPDLSIKKILILILLLTIPVLLPLTRSGYFPTQDYIYVARIYEMKRALDDGQFPVRWVPDFRYGEPLYNFYAPSAYYAGAVLKNFTNFLGFNLSYLEITKILFAIGFILSGFTMFLFAKELFGKVGGFIAALLYIYAPYHSVDVYVRGALSESWALIFFPLIFLFSYKLYKKVKTIDVVFLSLSLAGLFYTHNIMTVLSAPFILAWFILLAVLAKNYKLFLIYVGGLVLGVGLAASFLLPAFFEKSFVQSDKLITGYFDFRGHFVAIGQFFSTFWGYGASVWGNEDEMSFQVGIFYWLGLFVTLLLIIGLFFDKFKKKAIFAKILNVKIEKKEFEKKGVIFLFCLLAFLFSLFMMHNKSAFIWEIFDVLSFTQFPWRFLGISIFFLSTGLGIIAILLNRQFLIFVVPIFVVLVIIFNIGFFRPDFYYQNATDEDYISSRVLSLDDKLPKDYLPIWVKKLDYDKINQPQFVSGEGDVTNYNGKSSVIEFDVITNTGGIVEAPITYFPGWIVIVNNVSQPLLDPDEKGLIRFNVPEGTNKIKLIFGDTQVRSFGNIVTIISFAIALILISLQFRTKKVR